MAGIEAAAYQEQTRKLQQAINLADVLIYLFENENANIVLCAENIKLQCKLLKMRKDGLDYVEG